MTDRGATAITTLIFAMVKDGWKWGAPSPAVEELDRFIIEGDGAWVGKGCFRCGTVLSYLPFHKFPRQYEAWMVCPECGDTRQF